MKLKRTLTSTFDNMVSLVKRKEPSIDAVKKAKEEFENQNIKLRYYVTIIGNPKLSDIAEGVLVKTPAKYFDNLIQAKIFQDRIVIEESQKKYNDRQIWFENLTDEEFKSIKNEYQYLIKKYPEYAL